MLKKKAEFIYEVCGNCVWFTEPMGESKTTCPDRIGVTKTSRACSDFTEKPFNLSKIKESDAFLKTLRKNLKEDKFIIDSSIAVELESYFVVCTEIREGGKRLRVIPVCSYGPKEAAQLASLFEKTQAYRDRALSIKLGLLSKIAELRTIEAVGERYIYEHYNRYIETMKTNSIRETAKDILLEPLRDKIRETENILTKASLVYDNLKDTYFVLKEIKDIAVAFLTSTRMTV